MIRRLRIKFILISMLTFFSVLSLLVGVLNTVNFISTERRIDGMLELLVNNQGVIPSGRPHNAPNDPSEFPEGPDAPAHTADDDDDDDDNDDNTPSFPYDERGHRYKNIQITPETPYETRYFVVEYDSDGKISSCNTEHIAAVDYDEAIEYADSVISIGRSRGSVGGIYRYAVLTRPQGTTTVAFLDCYTQLSSRRTLLITSLAVEIICLFAAFIPVFFLSGRAIRPAVQSIEKQRRFITDASHEIKTPLAIISANTEVLEMTDGTNEWLDSIKNQTVRLNKLVARLVMLSKLEEERPRLSISDFDLSDAVIDAATPFGTLAECEGRSLRIDVEQEILYRGDEGAIRQLVSLLTENAVKYSDRASEIVVSLKRRGRENVLCVSNKCADFDISCLDSLFDRFYRTDSSRTRATGGYGIGLSVARAICEAHGGSISANYSDEGVISFTAIL